MYIVLVIQPHQKGKFCNHILKLGAQFFFCLIFICLHPMPKFQLYVVVNHFGCASYSAITLGEFMGNFGIGIEDLLCTIKRTMIFEQSAFCVGPG